MFPIRDFLLLHAQHGFFFFFLLQDGLKCLPCADKLCARPFVFPAACVQGNVHNGEVATTPKSTASHKKADPGQCLFFPGAVGMYRKCSNSDAC